MEGCVMHVPVYAMITMEQKAMVALLGFVGCYERDERNDGPLVALVLGALDATGEWPWGPLYLFSFGAYGDTPVVARGSDVVYALEHAASVLPPGMFTKPDYAAAASELGLDPEDGYDMVEIGYYAEAGLTYTEAGWLVSHEWTVREIMDAETLRNGVTITTWYA